MSDTGYKGLNDLAAAGSEFNAHSFLVWQILNTVRTATLVKVVNVTNDGDLSPVGFVDVQPLVAQLDGHGNVMPHGVIHNIPYFRIQGGTDAVIIDPKQNDTGICIFADRDISAVKSAKGAATPGSRRKFDMADGLYIGGVLNGVPQQYIQFTSSGIVARSPNAITCIAPQINLGADGQSLHALVTATFMQLFNQHSHPANGAAPTQQMTNADLTTTIQGG